MIQTSKKFNIRYEAVFTSCAPGNCIMVWVAQPTNSKYQKIEKFSVSPKPRSIYKDNNGNKILYFRLDDAQKINMRIDVVAVLSKTNLRFDVEHMFFPKRGNMFKRYTKSEKFLEQTEPIKKLTHDITKYDKTDTEKLGTIFDFVVKNFKYKYPVKNRGVKNLDINNLTGDCGEYSALLVTMCRILKIPVRDNTGFVVFPKQKQMCPHAWASVYSKNYGWIDVDTSYAQLEKTPLLGVKKHFLNRSDYRISFTNGINIPLKPKIPNNFPVNFFNNLELPMTHSAAQVLQPLVFASHKKIKLKDKIEFTTL